MMTLRDVSLGTVVAAGAGALGGAAWGGKEGAKYGALMVGAAGALMSAVTVAILDPYNEVDDLAKAAHKTAKTFDIFGLSD